MLSKPRYIVHVDMDAFFASVEQRDDPAYRGKPVIVGADPKGGKGRGVVAACSYEARKFGIHSAMPISTAYRKCPKGIFLPVDMKKYARASHKVFDVFEKFTPDIEPISIDEAFLDITGSWRLFGSPIGTCRKIKAIIKKETGLTASIGMAPNMMTAKIASETGKPDGLVVVEEKGLLKFLHPLPVDRLWGVGEKTQKALLEIGIKTIGALAAKGQEELIRIFGKHGEHMWELANGIDPRRVETDETMKSISNEHTFDADTKNTRKIEDTIMCLSEKVSRRLRRSGLKGKTVTLKIRLADFSTYTRSITIDTYTNFVDDIYNNSMLMADKFALERKKVRLLGVRVSNLVEGSQRRDLFDEVSDRSRKKESLHKALDKIVDRFGERAIHRRTA